jgi:hypothetical protein
MQQDAGITASQAFQPEIHLSGARIRVSGLRLVLTL